MQLIALLLLQFKIFLNDSRGNFSALISIFFHIITWFPFYLFLTLNEGTLVIYRKKFFVKFKFLEI